MPRKPSIPAIVLVINLLLFQCVAQTPQPQTAPPPTPQQLDQLLAPIALYPDSLLAQITTASTNPQEILDVDNWLATNRHLTGTALTDAAQQQGFDPAFIALVNFPTVLEMMAEHIDDYAAIGHAVTGDQAEVAASIQRLRSQAYESGALRSTPQQQVDVQQSGGQPIYAIQPASPQVVYVPQYDPTVVYVRPAGAVVATSFLSFGVGIGIGALLVSNQPWGWGGWGWNWGGRAIYYNRGPWSGWNGGYRPPRPWYRPRPIVWGNRPGYGGNWHYRPRNYRPPSSIHRPGFVRPGAGNRPVYSRPGGTPGYRPGSGSRPAVQPTRPSPGRPNPSRPATTRPTPTRPGGNQPSRPQTRPAPQARPAQPNQSARPAGRPSPGSRDSRGGKPN